MYRPSRRCQPTKRPPADFAHYHLHLLIHPRHSSLLPCGYYYHQYHACLSSMKAPLPESWESVRSFWWARARKGRHKGRPRPLLLLVLLTWAFVDSMMYHMVLLSPTSTHETKVVNEAVAEVDLTVTVDDCLRIEHQIDNTKKNTNSYH